ncbi:hypothetical protein F5Y03DRAFT_397841 [Xylaria venustula]|nr:hypothetical protein F5Y03DRAFT_397841 [Xylaria venustula]
MSDPMSIDTRPPSNSRSIEQPESSTLREKANDSKDVSKKSEKSRKAEKPKGQSESKSRKDLAAITKELNDGEILVYEPGDLEYELSVSSSNFLHRYTRPIYVIQPQSISDVQTTVSIARANNIPLTVKNSEHSFTGSSTNTGFFLVDMVRLDQVEVNEESRLMTVYCGALWGNAYKPLINARRHELAVNGARCPTVSVTDFILGGGVGPFSRTFGMGCDTVEEISMVTADGVLITVKASDKEHSAEGMTFWALCGGGAGNFGIIVRMVLRILELPEGGLVTAGRFTWYPDPIDDYRNLITAMYRFYTTPWSDRMTIDSSWFSDTEAQGGAIGIRFRLYYAGSESNFRSEIHKAALQKDLQKQFRRRVLPERSTRFFHESLAVLWDEETGHAFPSNGAFRISSSFCFGNSVGDAMAVTIILKEELEAFRRLFGGEPNCLCQVNFIHSGGQASRRTKSATAFRWRDALYHVDIMIRFRDKFLERDMRCFLGRFKDRLKPLSLMRQASLVAFPDESLGSTYEKAFYGGNYLRLRQVKRMADKTNFFRRPQGIKIPRSGSWARWLEAHESASARDVEYPSDESINYEMLTDAIASQRWDNAFVPATSEWLTTSGPEAGGAWEVEDPVPNGIRTF